MRVTEKCEAVFRPANLLDIPAIYRLAQLGSVAGAYTDSYLSGTGHVLLLRLLLWACVSAWFSGVSIGAGLSPLAVLELDGELIGFTWVQQAVGLAYPLATILMFSIAPGHLGKGFGQALLGHIVQRLPKGAVVRAECTPYASRMKTLLRRAGFIRQRQSLVRQGLVALDVYEKTIE